MFQAIIKASTINAMNKFEGLAQVTKNVANINTVGYKSSSFAEYLSAEGMVQKVERFDPRQGSTRMTNNNFDIALEGPGYIPVTNADGRTGYTRDGQLAVNSEGILTTLDGKIVSDGISIPVNYHKIIITPEGEIKVQVKEEEPGQTIGKIRLANFQNPSGLDKKDGNVYYATEESGEPIPVSQVDYIKQGFLESSNVNVYASVDQILRTNGSYIAGLRVIKFTDELYRQSVNLRQ